MATTYQTESEQIKRRRAIADSLRASGNEALPDSIHTGGRFDAPVSGWQYANKAVQQLLGGYMSNRADKAQGELDKQDQQVLGDVIAAKRAADAPSVNGDLNPDLQSDQGPTPVPLAARGQASQADRQQALQAAALRGVQFGGSAGPIAGELTERDVLPPVQSPYTLNEGDVRYDGKNNPIAAAPQKPVRESPEDRALVNIIDAKNPKGYRTINRSSFKEGVDQLYEKPNAGTTIAANFSAKGKELAAQTYRMTGKLPPGFSKSPQALMEIINLAADQAAAEGDTSKVAALRMQFNHAGQTALGNITKQQTMVGAFEKTAKLNGKMALDLSAQVDRTGAPLINSWINAGRKTLTGDTPLAKFSAANDTFVNEYAKIMSGSMGNTAVSDAARAHAKDLIGTAMNAQTYAGVMDTLNKEMDNRIAGFPQQIAELTSQLSATGDLPGASTTPAAPAETPPPVAPATKVIGGKTYINKTGKPDGWEEQ